MGSHHPPMRSLMLLGGQSSRMGSPKYLLPMPSEVSETGEEAPLLIHSLYLHHIFQVKHGDPLLRTVTLSVRDEVQRNEIKDLIDKYEDDLPVDLKIGYAQDNQAHAGPSAGLVAAWRIDGNAHWMVTGCDYPRASKEAFEELRQLHRKEKKAVTCFVSPEGCAEPLLAIWTGTALEKLNETIQENPNTDPNSVLEALEKEDHNGETGADYTRGTAKTKPSTEHWLTSVNTREEWNQVVQALEDKFTQSDP